MSTARARAAVGAVAAVIATAVGACGLPHDAGPDSVALPVELTSTTTTSTTLPPQETTERSLFLVQESRLAEVERQIQDPATADRVWAQLLMGPTPDEAEDGIRSSLPAGLEIIDSVITGDGNMIIDLNAAIDDIEGTTLVQAVAQLVYTALEFDAVGVQFRVDGVWRALPAGDGTVTPIPDGQEPKPLTKTDYPDLAPPDTSTSLP